MTTTTNFGITHVTTSDPEAETNTAMDGFDALLGDPVNIAVTTGTPGATISATDWKGNIVYVLINDTTPPSAGFEVHVPSTSKGIFIVRNDTAYTATIKISGQSKTAPTVVAGETKHFDSDGTNVMAPNTSISSTTQANGWELISLTDLAGTAADDIQITLDSATYYMFRIHGWIECANDGDSLNLTVSTNSGSSYESTNYNWNWDAVKNAGTNENSGANSASVIQTIQSLNLGDPAALMIEIIGAESTDLYTFIQGRTSYIDGSGNPITGYFGGHWAGTTVVNKIKLIFSTGGTGNIADGKLMLTGLRSSV